MFLHRFVNVQPHCRQRRRHAAPDRRARFQVEGIEGRQLMSAAPLGMTPNVPTPPALFQQSSVPNSGATQPRTAAAQAAVTTTLTAELTANGPVDPNSPPGFPVNEVKVQSLAGFPQDFPFYIKVDNEVMQVAFSQGQGAAPEFLVTRGASGTIAAPHEAGSIVTLVNGASQSQPPAYPGPLVAHVVSKSEIDLSWASANGANGYRLFYYTSTGWKQLGNDFPARQTSAAATGLQPGTTYYFKVEAFNNYGQTDSDWISATTLNAVPPTAPTLSVTRVYPTRVDLAWTASTGVKSYTVKWWNGTSYVPIWTTTNVKQTSLEVTGLRPGTTSWFIVQASNDDGVATSNQTSATTLTNPSSPSPLVVKVLSQKSISFSWSAAEGADGYRIWNVGGTPGSHGQPGQLGPDIPATQTSKVLTWSSPIAPGYKEVYVEAFNSAGGHSYSEMEWFYVP
jgi:hypothetical protein